MRALPVLRIIDQLLSEVWYSLRAVYTRSLPNSHLILCLVSTTFVLLIFSPIYISFCVLGTPYLSSDPLFLFITI